VQFQFGFPIFIFVFAIIVGAFAVLLPRIRREQGFTK